jgi:hypothetical protein
MVVDLSEKRESLWACQVRTAGAGIVHFGAEHFRSSFVSGYNAAGPFGGASIFKIT